MNTSSWRWPGADGRIDFQVPALNRWRLRRVVAKRDAQMLQQWFCSPRGRFWTMPDKSLAGVTAYYTRLQRSGHACAFLGQTGDRAAFVIECYDPAADALARHYQAQAGDLGLHLFVAPPVAPVAHFTRDAFRFVLAFMFDCLGALRVVVEPDIANTRIHVLNRRMGFRDAGTIAVGNKIARLAWCTRADFFDRHPLECRP